MIILRRRLVLSRAVSLFKFLVQFLFSHLGLCICISIYCIGGAYLFQLFELQDEIEQKMLLVNLSAEIFELNETIMEHIFTHTVLSNDTVYEWLTTYNRLVTEAVASGYDGSLVTEDDLTFGWSFASALLFTVSIVTTIGYGHISPASQIGKIVVIVYSLLGLPLMLIFLANIGDLLAVGFRAAYYHGCCIACRGFRRVKYRKELEAADDDSDTTSVHGTALPTFPREPKNRWKFAARAIIKKVYPGTPRPETPKEPPKHDADIETLRVPASLTISFIVVYLIFGALMFSAWEGWSVIEGVYFCFVTLSTVGFGDFYPTWSDLSSFSNKMKLLVSTVYIVLGLAVLSMSLNLMMEEIIAKVTKVANFFGIGKKKAQKPQEDEPSPPVVI